MASRANPSSSTRRMAWCRTPAVARSRNSAMTPTDAISRTWMVSMGLPSLEQQLDDDVHGVELGLTLGPRVVGVADVDRLLGPAQPGLPDLRDDLRGVGHPVLPDVQRLSRLA